ncbi:MAG: hypothetical protein R3E79_59150 [Caldilineaceae bacterium]
MSRSASVKHDIITSITTFGDLLRYLRQRQQMLQRDLAPTVGYNISAAWNIMNACPIGQARTS